MHIEINQHTKFGIIGLGKTGIATYNFLKSKARVICYDDKYADKCTEVLSEKVTNINDNLWTELDYIILSPGIPTKFPKPHKAVEIAQKFNIPIVSDIDIFFSYYKNLSFKPLYIAVTGTNGKSTTCKLLQHIFSHYTIIGNIGNPALDNVKDIDGVNISSFQNIAKDSGYVIELSSYHLEIIKSFTPDIAVITNIDSDHLDRHGTLENYIQAKFNIASQMNKSQVLLANIDDKHIKQNLYKVKNTNIVTFSLCDSKADIHTNEGSIIYKGEKIKLPNNKFLPGEHNLYNILASYGVSKHITTNLDRDRDVDFFIDRVNSFQGLPHRLQFIRKIDDIEFYNDSKATNTQACFQALNTFKNIFWLAGGVFKEENIDFLLELIKTNVQKAYLYGQAKEMFAKQLTAIRVEFTVLNNMQESFYNAFDDAKRSVATNKTILLSPSCASFDQFENFEQRGQKFVELIVNL